MAGGPTPIDVKSRKQLFVDYRFIESSYGISLQVSRPRKEGVVLAADKPWEAEGAGGYATILEDEGRYRMWYRASHHSLGLDDLRSPVPTSGCCYAESDDGTDGHKPALELFNYMGMKGNNFVMPGVGEGAVMLDPCGPPERKYLVLGMTSEFLSARAFWSETVGMQWAKYVAYLRSHVRGRTLGHVSLPVLLVGIGRILDEGGIPKLRRQQTATQNPLGIVVALRVPPAAHDKGRLEDVAGVVALAAIRTAIGPDRLGHRTA